MGEIGTPGLGGKVWSLQADAKRR